METTNICDCNKTITLHVIQEPPYYALEQFNTDNKKGYHKLFKLLVGILLLDCIYIGYCLI